MILWLFILTGGMDLSPECVESVFANKAVGGGVLWSGAVQEEIKYVTCPECLVILLLAYEPNFKNDGDVDFFQRSLLVNESFCINGTEIYSDYTGYSKNFRFKGPHDDRRTMKGMMRESRLLIFDATDVKKNPKEQFESSFK